MLHLTVEDSMVIVMNALMASLAITVICNALRIVVLDVTKFPGNAYFVKMASSTANVYLNVGKTASDVQ